jgi:hypothetical protein
LLGHSNSNPNTTPLNLMGRNPCARPSTTQHEHGPAQHLFSFPRETHAAHTAQRHRGPAFFPSPPHDTDRAAQPHPLTRPFTFPLGQLTSGTRPLAFPFLQQSPATGLRLALPATPLLWQNRLNYTGSNTQVLSPGLQRTSNGVTHWSVGSPPDTTTVQQDRSRFTSRKSEFTITVQLINF